MRNYKKYRSTVIDLFQSFLAGKIDERVLVYKLTEIENDLKQGRNTLKGIWFRFFKDDNLATTISNIYFNINSRYNSNHIKENMQISIDNPKGLQIYYS